MELDAVLAQERDFEKLVVFRGENGSRAVVFCFFLINE